MGFRVRLAMAATALLYLGPLMAGLAGYGLAMVPLFFLIFVLWLIVMRPQLWPRRLADWKRGDLVLRLAAQLAVQALLVLLCFGVGRGIGGVAGMVPLLPPVFLLALSFLAVPLTRLLWDAERANGLEHLMQDAIRRVEPQTPVTDAGAGTGMGAGAGAAEDALLLQRQLRPVLDLPDDTPDDRAMAAVEAALAGAAGLPGDALRALVDRLDAMDPPRPAARRGLILWGTGPGHRTPGALRAAFAVTWIDPGLLQLFARRALDLVQADPGALADFPDVAELRYGIEDQNPPGLNAQLAQLADLVEAARAAAAAGPAGTAPL